MNTREILSLLLEVSKSLEDQNYVREADKVNSLMVRVAQEGKPGIWDMRRSRLPNWAPSGSSADKALKFLRLRGQEGQSIIPGLSDPSVRVVGDFGFDLGSKDFVEATQLLGAGNKSGIQQRLQKIQEQKRIEEFQKTGLTGQEGKSQVFFATLARRPVYSSQEMIKRLMEIGKASGNNSAEMAADIFMKNGGQFGKIQTFKTRVSKVPPGVFLPENILLQFMDAPINELLIDHYNPSGMNPQKKQQALSYFTQGPATPSTPTASAWMSQNKAA